MKGPLGVDVVPWELDGSDIAPLEDGGVDIVRIVVCLRSVNRCLMPGRLGSLYRDRSELSVSGKAHMKPVGRCGVSFRSFLVELCEQC